MSNWYDPDHISNGTVKDNIEHQENNDWDCEIELSCHKKENDGRVNTIFMRYLRDKYGQNVADRALKSAQKRDQRAIHITSPTETQMISGVF